MRLRPSHLGPARSGSDVEMLEKHSQQKIEVIKLTLSPQKRYKATCRLRTLRLPPLAGTV